MKQPKIFDYVFQWIFWAVILVGIPSMIAILVTQPNSSAYTYVETFTDANCLTSAPSGKIQPPDNTVCSAVDSGVRSYKYSQVGTNCQVWLYGANDTTCSSLTPAPLLRWHCYDTSVYGRFIIYCPNPSQPDKYPPPPPPPVTATRAFKLGIGLGSWVLTYIIIATWITWDSWKTDNAKWREINGIRPAARGDVKLVRAGNAGESQPNDLPPPVQATTPADNSIPASRRGKTFLTTGLSRTTSLFTNSDRSSTSRSTLPPYEPNT